MSQNFQDDCFNYSGHTVISDMQQMENNFAALKSMFSGASAPPDLVAGMLWFHTTNKIPKIRNNANDAWLGVMQGDASHKLWVYRNTAPDGWAVDSGVTDSVLALKGGSQAYNANGGTTGGTWTQPDCALSEAQIPAHTHGARTPTITVEAKLASSSSGTINVSKVQIITDSDGDQSQTWVSTYIQVTATQAAHTHDSVGSGAAHNHGTAYRPAAALGTMQYMNI
jgi:hypothetical protein